MSKGLEKSREVKHMDDMGKIGKNSASAVISRVSNKSTHLLGENMESNLTQIELG